MKKTKVTVTEKYSNQIFNCLIEIDRSIQINCFHTNHINPKQTEVCFQIGDLAEYDSYNLSYLGKIIKISTKTVTINASSTGREIKRLKLNEFCSRNWDFDLEKIESSNAETMMCI